MGQSRSLEELMTGCGVSPGSREGERLQAYLKLLEKWNPRINLTAATEWRAVRDFFAEALWAAGRYPRGRVEHLDIGSGGGFPAIPMQIVLPGMRLHLVEPRAKRAAFLETAVAELGLNGTEVFCGRVEEWLGREREAGPGIVSWKGLKLGTDALERLRQAGGEQTRLWLFHGEEMPLEDPEAAGRMLRTVCREEFPGRAGWRLSICEFHPSVSRETGAR
jgi:16S rRNA (guanine(527)-N(7))-methyltransferase RsmG